MTECIDCGQETRGGGRCPICSLEHQFGAEISGDDGDAEDGGDET
ncbi:hypothetical protein [Halobaculum sp. D14]